MRREKRSTLAAPDTTLERVLSCAGATSPGMARGRGWPAGSCQRRANCRESWRLRVHKRHLAVGGHACHGYVQRCWRGGQESQQWLGTDVHRHGCDTRSRRGCLGGQLGALPYMQQQSRWCWAQCTPCAGLAPGRRVSTAPNRFVASLQPAPWRDAT